MTMTLVRVPLTLAAALAFHVSMSPPLPLTSEADTPDDRCAVCGAARFVTTILTKVRQFTHLSSFFILTFSLGPLLGFGAYGHPRRARAVRPHVAPQPSPHLYPTHGDAPLSMGIGPGPESTHIRFPPLPPTPTSRDSRGNDACPRWRISAIRCI